MAATATKGGKKCPWIIVTADGPPRQEQAIVLQERVGVEDFESDQFSARLVERIGWAMLDADELEHMPEPNPVAERAS